MNSFRVQQHQTQERLLTWDETANNLTFDNNRDLMSDNQRSEFSLDNQ